MTEDRLVGTVDLEESMKVWGSGASNYSTHPLTCSANEVCSATNRLEYRIVSSIELCRVPNCTEFRVALFVGSH